VVLARVAAWGGRIWRAAIFRNLMRRGCLGCGTDN